MKHTMKSIALIKAKQVAIECLTETLKGCDFFLIERKEKHSAETLNYYSDLKIECINAIEEINYELQRLIKKAFK